MNHPYFIKLVLGDPSDDGHGQTEVYTLSSNLDQAKLWSAYHQGVKLLGFDFINSVATEYENSLISADQVNSLIQAGYSMNPNETSIWRDDFKNIFLFIVKLGNPEFQYELIDSLTMDIGGYGLF